jgi:hypothetical protein
MPKRNGTSSRISLVSSRNQAPERKQVHQDDRRPIALAEDLFQTGEKNGQAGINLAGAELGELVALPRRQRVSQAAIKRAVAPDAPLAVEREGVEDGGENKNVEAVGDDPARHRRVGVAGDGRPAPRGCVAHRGRIRHPHGRGRRVRHRCIRFNHRGIVVRRHVASSEVGLLVA